MPNGIKTIEGKDIDGVTYKTIFASLKMVIDSQAFNAILSSPFVHRNFI